MKKILLVEDDAVILKTLQTSLTESGYAITTATTLAEARRALTKQNFDLVLTDINLPDGTSFSFCRDLRAEEASLPLVMITANLDEESAVKGLSLGASDYIRKPFGRKELMLRLKRLLGERGGELRAGDLVLNLDRQRVTFRDQEVALTPRELSILRLFLENLKNVVSREKILEKIDPEGSIVDKTLNSHISQLRAKLQKAGLEDFTITPVYGAGYRMERKE